MESRMAIQVIDNFLEKEVFNNIKNIILGDHFPWYYNDFMTRDPDAKFYFTHTFYREPGVVSDLFNMWLPSVPHASSLCDNRKRRVTVNFNYF